MGKLLSRLSQETAGEVGAQYTSFLENPEAFAEVFDTEYLKTLFSDAAFKEVLPVLGLLKNGNGELTRTDVEFFVSTRIKTQIVEAVESFQSCLETSESAPEASKYLTPTAVYTTDRFEGQGFSVFQGAENVVAAISDELGLLKDVKRTPSQSDNIMCMPDIANHGIIVTAIWSLNSTSAKTGIMSRVVNFQQMTFDYNCKIREFATKVDITSKKVFNPDDANLYGKSVSRYYFPRPPIRCELKINTERFIAKINEDGEVLVRPRPSGMLVLIADNTEHILDFREQLKCAVSTFSYENATLESMEVLVKHLKMLHTLNYGFESICLISDVPTEGADSESGDVEWRPTATISAKGKDDMRDEESDARKLLEILKIGLHGHSQCTIHLLGCSSILNLVPHDYLYSEDDVQVLWDAPGGLPRQYLKGDMVSRTISTYRRMSGI